MDGCCIVCAEPLEWTAYGSCGHMETCSKCVVRLRQVMGDKRCVICQQQLEAVYVTRYMGDYTTRLRPEDFDKLLSRAMASELFHMNQVNVFFDDEEHYKNIKEISSITHPILDGLKDVPSFRTISALRRFIQDKCKKSLCTICLEGRKVFVGEQILYDKDALHRHMAKGDSEGPLGVAGFKGHPLCRFCSKRFYSENELFAHNQHNHETCFICRRGNPDHYFYYRNYDELEDHFRDKHYPCPYPDCLAKKFVVFGTEAELNQHCAREHKDNLSRSQLREALALETNFKLRRAGDAEANENYEAHNRAGVVIGGGGNVQSRIVRSQGRGPPQDARDTRTSPHSRQQNETVPYDNFHRDSRPAQQSDLSGADFPSLQGDATGAGSSNGNWAGRGGSHQGPPIRPEDFPSLPSEQDKGKGKKKGNKSSGRGAWGQAPIAPNRSEWGSSAQVIKKNSKPPESSKKKPTLSSQSKASPAGGSSRQPSGQPPPGPSWIDVKGKNHAPLSQPKRQALPPESQETSFDARGFPSLVPSSSHTAKQPQWQAKGNKTKHQEAKPPPKLPVAKKEDFPTLSSQPSHSNSSMMPQGGPSQNQSGAEEISQELRATTKSLASKIKAQIPRSQYQKLKDSALQFCEGELSPDDYHDIIVDLEIVQYAGALAAVCPMIQKGFELFEVHRRFVKLASQSPECAPANVPIEVLVAGIKNLEKEGLAWYCSSCKIINSSQADFCEICDRGKPRVKLSEMAGTSSLKAPSKNSLKTQKTAGTSKGGYRKKNNQDLFGGNVRKGGNSPWGGVRK